MEEDASCLCGLIVDGEDEGEEEDGPLDRKRSEREGGMVAMWMES